MDYFGNQQIAQHDLDLLTKIKVPTKIRCITFTDALLGYEKRVTVSVKNVELRRIMLRINLTD